MCGVGMSGCGGYLRDLAEVLPPALTKRVDPTFQLTLIVSSFIFVQNSSGRQPVQVGFRLVKQLERFIGIVGCPEALHHCAHFAPVRFVAQLSAFS